MIKLANYKIIKKIASGGMGDVYLAEHEVLENKVVIKSLHSNLTKDEGFRKRFRTEAKTQFNLSHPNIVKLIDFQEQEDGLFLIMEYIEGKQLNDYIANDTGPIPEEKLAPLFLQMLSAIKYAHSKGLVHRDIKPANIMITPEGKVKVIDFGIAKESDQDSGLTKTGVQVGTVSYMSPEQVNAEKVDKRSDIYSLGVTLFQMAVGKSPYEGQTNQFKIQLSIVTNPFPKAKHHYPSVSDKLEAIIEKATQNNKSERFQSCEEFIQSFKNTSWVGKEEKITKKEIKVKDPKYVKPKIEEKKLSDDDLKYSSTIRNTILLSVVILFIGFFIYKGGENTAFEQRLEKESEYLKIKEARQKSIASQKKQDDKIKAEIDAIKKEAKRKGDAKRKKEAKRKDDAKRKKEAKRKRAVEKKFPDGTYFGEVNSAQKPHGYGVFKYYNKEVYKGNFRNGSKEGDGIFESKRNKYVGKFKDNRKNDLNGKFYYYNGDVYIGGYVNDKKHGKGVLTYKNGFYEQLNYTNNLKNGFAIYFNSKGVKKIVKKYKMGSCISGC